ncbi:two-component sensor histidine kinase [Streptomyces solincola]|uniref:Oxygen sensor histidine kinase NreB n=1 Tax=Streptomyces solincola TaxID=2100817 RepID=A0A2S9PQZ7_9ACTN|nr:histidine kinase [Streptomyces solincola]PRH76845.1 two-component sensor histidine kinase [Streptomyces solincola]
MSEPDGPDDPDGRWLERVLRVAFFLLLGASLARFLLRHPWADRGAWVVALSAVLALLYVVGDTADRAGSGSPPAAGPPRPARRLLWLGAVVAVWVVLVVLAPSFAWCAVPLFYTGLRTLPTRASLALVVLLTAFVMAAQSKLAGGAGFDPNLLVAPPAVAAVATAVFIRSQRQSARQRALIDDLVRTRRGLAEAERRAGALAERQRLSMEIHDTLAQGLSSQRMLLQAAERTWDADPATARSQVRTAAAGAEHGLAEARRFVHGLAPADLARGGGLEEALRAVAARESAELRVDGTPPDAVPERVQAALVRIAQGALANVREHAAAGSAALSLTYLDDQLVLDVADDGRGFDPGLLLPGAGPAPGAPGASPAPGADGRGHGLPAMRARVRQLGGVLTVESAPGEGTVLSAAIPLHPLSPDELEAAP